MRIEMTQGTCRNVLVTDDDGDATIERAVHAATLAAEKKIELLAEQVEDLRAGTADTLLCLREDVVSTREELESLRRNHNDLVMEIGEVAPALVEQGLLEQGDDMTFRKPKQYVGIAEFAKSFERLINHLHGKGWISRQAVRHILPEQGIVEVKK